MANSYKSETEIEGVVRGFESCTTGKDSFTHRDHLAVAVWYLRHDADHALDLMRASLHRFLDHYNCRKNYHETLTRFWIQRVETVLETLPAELTLTEVTNAVVERLKDSKIAFDYYSKEIVESAAAKEKWIEPDQKKL
jgi:hypothetical protein